MTCRMLSRCHLLAALDKSLDCWCFSIASDPDFDMGVTTWNRLQARDKNGKNGSTRTEVSSGEFGFCQIVLELSETQALLKCVGRSLGSSFIAMQVGLVRCVSPKLKRGEFSSNNRCVHLHSLVLSNTVFNEMPRSCIQEIAYGS